MARPVSEIYVDSSISWMARKDLLRFPGKILPAAMRAVGETSASGWSPWQPIASTVTDEILNAIESKMGTALPPEYRTFLKYKHFDELMPSRGVRFERHLRGEWLQRLARLHFHPSMHKHMLLKGYVPFGSEAFMDAGYVCFDTNRRDADGDCPVVYWDHEWIGTPKEIGPMFSSSVKMFEALNFTANQDLNFFHGDPKDDAGTVSKKRELLAQFLAFDEAGAGGPGRRYWTSWGVVP